MLQTMVTSKKRRKTTRTAPPRERPARKRGEAQRTIMRHIIEHKEAHNGQSPTYEELAEYMGYSHPNIARNVVMSIVSRNKPDKPYMVYVEGRGLHWLDVDDKRHLVLPRGVFVPEPGDE